MKCWLPKIVELIAVKQAIAEWTRRSFGHGICHRSRRRKNKNQCKNCHEEHNEILAPLGPKARHMNDGGQLEALIDAGVLTGAPADPTTWARTPVFDDPATGGVEVRVSIRRSARASIG